MYIGKYNPNYFVQSYATIQSNCMEIGKGKFEWNGGEGVATGSSCAAARQSYCNKYGKNGKCYGDPGGPVGNVSGSGNNNYNKLATLSGQPVAVASQQGGKTVISNRGNSAPPKDNGCAPRACPPPSNQTDIIGYWNMGACHFGNLTCHQLPDWGFTVVAGIGGLLLLGLLVRKRR